MDKNKNVRIRTIFETLGGDKLKNEVNKLKLKIKDFASIQTQLGHSIAPNIKLFKETAIRVQEYGKMASSGKRMAESQRLVNQLMSGFAQKLINNSDKINELGDSYNSFSKVIGMPFEKWKKFNKEGGEFGSKGAKIANSIRKLTQGFQGFRMELLSVLFLGMGMQRFFSGLLKPAFEAVGLFDLWATILTIVFLPVAIKLLEWSVKFFKWIMKAENLQRVIRWITVFGVAIGTILMFLGSFLLGLGGLIAFFGPLIAVFVSAIGIIASFIAALVASPLGIGLLIAGLVALAGGFTKIGAEVDKQGGIFNMISNLIGNAISGIIGWLDRMWERFIDWDSVTQFLQMMGLSEEAINKIKNPIATLGDYFINMWDKFLKQHPTVLKKMQEMGFTAEEILRPWKNLDSIIPKLLDTLTQKIQKLVTDAIDKLEQSNVGQAFLRFVKIIDEQVMPKLEVLWGMLKKVYEFAEKVGILKAMNWLANSIFENEATLAATAGGAAIGGVVGGPVGAVAGGVIGYSAEQMGEIFGQIYAVLVDIKNKDSSLNINLTAPSGYEATARMSGGRT